jgi:hypothetical protein
VVSVITVVDLTAAANDIFYDTYDPFTPLLSAAAFYWVLINLIRIAIARLDRRLNRHLTADEQRARATTAPTPSLARRFLPIGRMRPAE